MSDTLRRPDGFMPIAFVDPDGRSYGIVKDASTGAQTTIDYAHHEVHGGSAYIAYNNAVLANGNLNTISILTPDSEKWSHLLFNITATADATLDILEDVTSIASGAAFTPLNFNRNSDNTSGNTVKVGDTPGSDPIVPTGGNEIWSESFGTRGLTTSRMNASELILKQNSLYLFRVTNGVNANTVTITLTWYEHSDRE